MRDHRSSQFVPHPERGMSFIEVLTAVTMLGTLGTAGVVAVEALREGDDSACAVSQMAATAGSLSFLIDEHRPPVSFAELTDSKALVLPAGAVVSDDGTIVQVGDWSLALGADGASIPSFTCQVR